MESKLIDRNELKKLYPALFSKPNRLSYLTNIRAIPVVKIGNQIYFDTEEIRMWIESKKIKTSR